MLGSHTKHIHCIGIGGIGVSALAEMLLLQGYRVSGSDLISNRNTERLNQLGAKVSLGHSADNIRNPDGVVFSSAISTNNPEYIAAEKNKIPLLSRGALLAELVNQFRTITVAGTHGKTTTTGLIAHLLMVAGHDPSYVIGGILNNQASPAHLGQGEFCVVEADESDASFLFMQPQYTIITNIDADHLEAYHGDFEKLKSSFLDFLNKIPSHGAAIVCIDDPIIRSLIPKITCRLITYGFSEQASVRACYFNQNGMISEFTVRFDDEQTCIPATLALPGQHNVLNALAAIALVKELNIANELIQKALNTFPGVGRRFHGHGQMRLAKGCALVFEDYGHHPKEIRATLEAAKLAWPDRRVVVVFQPHRYSRTRDLYNEFISVLKEADKLYLVDVYGAGEDPIDNISSVRIAEEVAENAKTKPDYVADIKLLPEILYQDLHDNDIVILQGAGNIGAVSKQLPMEE